VLVVVDVVVRVVDDDADVVLVTHGAPLLLQHPRHARQASRQSRRSSFDAARAADRHACLSAELAHACLATSNASRTPAAQLRRTTLQSRRHAAGVGDAAASSTRITPQTQSSRLDDMRGV
jgi:hypothetical protein